ncbi:MAG TPA: hypothetical protein VJB66_01805 [Candidatus Nanoarchaeia archaeon]|nr:hypothetical protein [Candidatus Nanoarchaeia archaeon]
MASKLKKFAAAAVLSGSMLLGTHYGNLALIDGTISTQLQDNSTLEVPRYAWRNVRPLRCSKYVREAAEDLFGLHYSKSDAWNRRYHDTVVRTLGEGDSLEDLADSGVLTPGMIVGIRNPHSRYADRLDEKGETVKYTHVGLYLGQNSQGESLIADLYGSATFVRTEKDLHAAGLKAVEVLAPQK